MRKVYVPLKQSEVEALIRLATEERRRPQDQAALIIAERLKTLEPLGTDHRADQAAAVRGTT